MTSGRLAAVLLVAGWVTGCATIGGENTMSFTAQNRVEARGLEGKGRLAEAQLRWRYVAALAPGDSEAMAEIQRLAGLIRFRRDALVAEGEAAIKAGRTRQAVTLYLKALALDGTDSRARKRLAEMDAKTMVANQDKKDQKAMSEYAAQVHDNAVPESATSAQSSQALPNPVLADPALFNGAPTADRLRR